MLQVKHKNTDLLKHPVVSELLKHKWKNYGLPVFVINFMLHTIFVCLLTTIVWITPLPQRAECQSEIIALLKSQSGVYSIVNGYDMISAKPLRLNFHC